MKRLYTDIKDLVKIPPIKGKKGFLPIWAMIVLAVVAIILLFSGLSIFIYILSANVFQVAGITLLIITALGMVGVFPARIPPKYSMWLVAVALVLLILPLLGIASNLTLGAVMTQ
jgi:hypothetical protein